jgi:hypothetical protein
VVNTHTHTHTHTHTRTNVYIYIPYFIEHSAYMGIVSTLILQPFLGHYLVNHKPFFRYLPSIICRQNFIIISFVKKCAMIYYDKVKVYSYHGKYNSSICKESIGMKMVRPVACAIKHIMIVKDDQK